MNLKFIRKGFVIVTLATAIIAPAGQLVAAETTDIRLTNSFVKDQKVNIEFQTLGTEKVFVNVEEDYSLVMATEEADSAWTGKVFADTHVTLVEEGEEWSKIESGNVVGYVKTESLIKGKEAAAYSKLLLEEAYPEKNIFSLTQEEKDAVYSVAVSKEEEEARLAAEEAARIAAEKARIAAEKEASKKKGQEVVDYAKQFIGNPYVYGGTSLTRGADCSGFVKSVYKHFGISLPRTSYEMRRVGQSVSYQDIQPGDIVCYSGHVGIYAGNGKLINAIDEQRGINLSSATHRKIITIRRIF